MNQESPQATCERCGAPARVRIRPNATADSPIHRFCSDCAQAYERELDARRRGLSINRAAIVAGTGLFVLVLSLGADWFHFGRGGGFGVKQGGGLAVACILLFVGTLLRVATLTLLGGLLGGLTLLADVLGFGNTPGFGVQQRWGTALGLGLLVIGLILGRRRRSAAGETPATASGGAARADQSHVGDPRPDPHPAPGDESGASALQESHARDDAVAATRPDSGAGKDARS